MKQKSSTCNRRYLLRWSFCLSGIARHDQDIITNDEGLTKFLNRHEIVSRECFRHLASVIQRRPGSDHSCFGIPSSFVIRHSSTKDVPTWDRARPQDNDCPIHRTPVQSSLRRVVFRSAQRFRVLPFLFATFRQQFPPAEPLLLNLYHPSSSFEINRVHHLRPLAEDNR